MILQYIKTRLIGWKFLILAFLLMLLIFDPSVPYFEWGLGAIFLWVSFLVFRFLDDAGSVQVDREDYPDRTYLTPSKIPKFVRLSLLLMWVYLNTLAFISVRIFAIVCVLVVFSVLFYMIFRKNRLLLSMIPLLKYPVLLGCLSLWLFDTISIPILLVSLLLMVLYELLEKIQFNSFQFWIAIALLLACGLLLFQPGLRPLYWSFVFLIFLIIPLINKGRNVQIIPILYYPIVSLILHLYP